MDSLLVESFARCERFCICCSHQRNPITFQSPEKAHQQGYSAHLSRAIVVLIFRGMWKSDAIADFFLSVLYHSVSRHWIWNRERSSSNVSRPQFHFFSWRAQITQTNSFGVCLSQSISCILSRHEFSGSIPAHLHERVQSLLDTDMYYWRPLGRLLWRFFDWHAGWCAVVRSSFTRYIACNIQTFAEQWLSTRINHYQMVHVHFSESSSFRDCRSHLG